MKKTAIMDTTATLTLSLDQLRIIHQALNEVCNALAVPDFETRLGASREEAGAIMRQIRELVQQLQAQPVAPASSRHGVPEPA